MTPEETSQVLALAASLDPRMRPPSDADALVRARAWSEALSPSMTLQWAVKAVVSHYGRTTDALMPAHLNERWKAYQRDEAERLHTLQLRAGEGVPMPAEIKERWNALVSSKAVE